MAKEKTEEKEELDIFKALQGEKITSLQDTINDINQQVEQREKLEQDIFNDIEKAKSKINSFIMQVESQITPGERTALMKEIITFKSKETDLEQMKIEEKLGKFRDIAELKKELRTVVQEFKEKESSADILDQILEK